MKYFGYHLSDWMPCEICGCQAVDIHHIECRSMGGTKTKDTIENLMALCRGHHVQFGDKKQHKEMLIEVHNNFIKQNGK
jgi:predicted restriction endonuclease